MAFELLWYHYVVTGKTLNAESTASAWSWALLVKPTQVHLTSPRLWILGTQSRVRERVVGLRRGGEHRRAHGWTMGKKGKGEIS